MAGRTDLHRRRAEMLKASKPVLLIGRRRLDGADDWRNRTEGHKPHRALKGSSSATLSGSGDEDGGEKDPERIAGGWRTIMRHCRWPPERWPVHARGDSGLAASVETLEQSKRASQI
ncbi:hypothetical protein Dimus_006600, partial [Dionaea muscipula]